MKLKAVVGALVVGAIGATVAFAAPAPNNHGKGHTTASTSTATSTSTSTSVAVVTTSTGSTTHGNKPACIPQVMLIVKGTATGAGTDSSLAVNITGGNHFAKLLFQNNTTTSLTLNKGKTTTVTNASGKTESLTSFQKGDRVLAQYKVCKSSITGKSVNVSSASALASYLSTSVSPRKIVNLGQGNA